MYPLSAGLRRLLKHPLLERIMGDSALSFFQPAVFFAEVPVFSPLQVCRKLPKVALPTTNGPPQPGPPRALVVRAGAQRLPPCEALHLPCA